MAAHDSNCRMDLSRWARDFSMLSEAHQSVLKDSMHACFKGVEQAIVANQVNVITNIVIIIIIIIIIITTNIIINTQP